MFQGEFTILFHEQKSLGHLSTSNQKWELLSKRCRCMSWHISSLIQSYHFEKLLLEKPPQTKPKISTKKFRVQTQIKLAQEKEWPNPTQCSIRSFLSRPKRWQKHSWKKKDSYSSSPFLNKHGWHDTKCGCRGKLGPRMMDVVIFLLDVPKHCIQLKTMGHLGARSFVVFAPTIHNIVQSGNLRSHPRDMFCKNFEANNYLITNLTHSKRAYNNSNTMPTRNYHCSTILQRSRNIKRCGCYVDSANLGACMGDTLQLHPFVQAKEGFSPSSPLLVCFPLEWKKSIFFRNT